VRLFVRYFKPRAPPNLRFQPGSALSDGKPNFDTVEIVATLEAVLKKHPNHLGANHHYIHAVEASNDPARALPSANRLAALAPAAGHLVHMPANIYIRTGRYHTAAVTNENAIKVDEEFFDKNKEGGAYPIMYYSHNIHFLCYSQMMEGRSRDALASARKLNSRVTVATVREMLMAFAADAAAGRGALW
jgi:hypothetical protein